MTCCAPASDPTIAPSPSPSQPPPPRLIHGSVIKVGFFYDVFVGNTLLTFYGTLGDLLAAKQVFDEMLHRDVVSWNSLISVFSSNGLYSDAVRLLLELKRSDLSVNSVSLISALPACAALQDEDFGKEIHGLAIKAGLDMVVTVGNAFIDMYGKCGDSDASMRAFQSMQEKNDVSWNSVIGSLGHAGLYEDALEKFKEMLAIKVKPNSITISSALSACGNLSALKQGKEIHCLSMRKLFDTHLFVANSLIDLYTKCGRIALGKKIFDRISNKDVASWNAMILGYGMQGELEAAINLFDLMKDEGLEYDHVSYIAVLSACSHAGLVERGKRYFDQMLAQNIRPTQMHYACMVDLLGRAGLMTEAAELVRSMPFEADSNVWGALLGACRIHGNIELAQLAAEHLFKLKPGHCGYYILLSNMYAEVGRWNEADKVRALMKSRKVKKNPGCSWVQIGNKLRAFLVGEGSQGSELELCYDELVKGERMSSAYLSWPQT
ncbi:PPR repeat [Musa troglodytarum]|uniref:PPR repeat n=1 Tax=Musa troglodytarum TaxID=320322 RepID=A0A9E7F5J4_9LILI|nr:PPR repeat [Musa troglodytarum]